MARIAERNKRTVGMRIRMQNLKICRDAIDDVNKLSSQVSVAGTSVKVKLTLAEFGKNFPRNVSLITRCHYVELSLLLPKCQNGRQATQDDTTSLKYFLE